MLISEKRIAKTICNSIRQEVSKYKSTWIRGVMVNPALKHMLI